MKPRILFHVLAVMLLLASVAAAQTPKQKAKTAPTGASADRESSSPSVSEREAGSGMATGRRQHAEAVVQPREAGSGMATGRKSGSIIVLDRGSSEASAHAPASSGSNDRESSQPSVSEAGVSLNAKNSGHATETLKMSNAQSNPTYKDSGMQGTNPPYQGKDRTATPASAGKGPKPEVIEYKDGEDGVSHTRPGNHKPSK